MARLRGFPPVGAPEPKVLILGSFPSALSLSGGQYYGNHRNHFWPMVAGILSRARGEALAPPCPPDYASRLRLLEEGGIALWDVIGSCEREGSLDEAIVAEEPNGIPGFLRAHPSILAIGLNGGKAAASFRKHFCPALGARPFAMGKPVEWKDGAPGGLGLTLVRLPSTSPIPTRDYRSASDKEGMWEDFILGSVTLGRPADQSRS